MEPTGKSLLLMFLQPIEKPEPTNKIALPFSACSIASFISISIVHFIVI